MNYGYMRLIALVIMMWLGLIVMASAETVNGEYGYYYYQNEITAKDRIIPNAATIKDDESNNGLNGRDGVIPVD